MLPPSQKSSDIQGTTYGAQLPEFQKGRQSGVRETGSGDIIQEGEAVAAEGAEFPGRSSVLSP